MAGMRSCIHTLAVDREGVEVGEAVGFDVGIEEGADVGLHVRNCPAIKGAQVGLADGLHEGWLEG